VGAAALLAVTVLGTAALAADPPPTPTAGSTATQRTNYRDVFLDKLAGALGIDRAKLDEGLKKAATDTIDQAVTNGDLARNPADAMKQRIQQSGPEGILGFGGFGFGRHGRGELRVETRGPLIDGDAIFKAVADKLGLSVADLQTQLRSKTLAALAQEKNVNVQDLYKAAADAAKPQLDQAVKDGKLTQAQADQIYQQILQGQHVLGGKMVGGMVGPMGGRIDGPMVGPMGRMGRR
jgi:polyhydroxyalkanoate synthesis regulator phasin